MTPSAVENQHVSLTGYHDLDHRPAFKMAIQEIDNRWYLYLGHFWHRGWSIVDVTDPECPSLRRFVSGPSNTSTKQIQVADGLMVTGLERPMRTNPPRGESTDPSDSFETGVYLWDVEQNPTNPELLNHYETGGWGTHRNFYAGGDYAYLCTSPAGFEPHQPPGEGTRKNAFLSIIDVSDPTHPHEVTRWMWPGQDPDDEVDEPLAHYFHGPAYVQGDRAYLSYGRVGAVTLDISDRGNPEVLYQVDFGDALGSGLGVHSFIPVPETDLAVVNSEAIREDSPLDGEPRGYVFLLNVADEVQPEFPTINRHKGPRVVSSLPLPTPESDLPYDSYDEKAGRFGPHNQHHPRGEPTRLQSNELLFLTYFNAGLRIFDISEPLVPREVGYYVPEAPKRRISDTRPESGLVSQLEDVVVDSRGYIYCTDPNHGLFILESTLL